MTPKQISKILDEHHIGHSVIEDMVLADHWFTFRKGEEVISDVEVVNVTDYTKEQLYIWLGY